DVVTGRDDHVVGARLVPEVAVVIHQIGVAGDVPAVLDVCRLPPIREIAAPGRPPHREAADRAGRTVAPILVDYLRLVAGDGLAGRASAVFGFGRADEDVHHLGRADAVEDFQTGRCVPGIECRLGQHLAGGDAFA